MKCFVACHILLGLLHIRIKRSFSSASTRSCQNIPCSFLIQVFPEIYQLFLHCSDLSVKLCQVNHVFFQYKKTTKFCSIKISHRYFTTSSKRDCGRMNESVQWIWQLGPSHIFVWGARCFQIGIHLFAKGCETRRYKHWYSFDLFILCVLASWISYSQFSSIHAPLYTYLIHLWNGNPT